MRRDDTIAGPGLPEGVPSREIPGSADAGIEELLKERLSLEPSEDAADYLVRYPPLPKKPDYSTDQILQSLTARLEDLVLQTLEVIMMLKDSQRSV